MQAKAIIVAGGTGSRVGGSLPKQFQILAGKPLIFHTLWAFESCPLIHSILLVLASPRINPFKSDLLTQPPLKKLKKIVAGGTTRQASAWAGLQAIESEPDIVVVHDGARPLVTSSLIEKSVQEALEHGAAVVACKAQDTLKEVDRAGFICRTLDRNKIYHAQTPQAFRFSLLKQAFEWAKLKNLQFTDEACLLEQQGIPIKTVESDTTNLKITGPEDFIIAESILRIRSKKVEIPPEEPLKNFKAGNRNQSI